MILRKANLSDTSAIQILLTQLGYSNTNHFLLGKFEQMLLDPNEIMLVYEANSTVVAFISVHFIPQIALQGDFARISYFTVNEGARSKGIGTQIEDHITMLAQERKCDRIEVHCHSRRTDAHRFYFRKGFKEAPKYFIKKFSTK